MTVTCLRNHHRHLSTISTLSAADFAAGGLRTQKPSRQKSYPQAICGFSLRVLTLPSLEG